MKHVFSYYNNNNTCVQVGRIKSFRSCRPKLRKLFAIGPTTTEKASASNRNTTVVMNTSKTTSVVLIQKQI